MGRRELIGALAGGGVVAGIVWLVVNHARATDRRSSPAQWIPPVPLMPPPSSNATQQPPPRISMSTAAWQPIVDHLIATLYPKGNSPFSMAWMQMESDGNVCAVGDPGSLGPDGNPREIGLGQAYNPDDFQKSGTTAAPFRAYAPNAAALAPQYLAAKAIGDTQTMAKISREMQTATRPLTDAEKEANVRVTLLDIIDRCRVKADQLVAKDQIVWTAPDYWKLVKAPHALPGILNEGMPAVVAKLHRAPVDWNEFRTALGMDLKVLDPKTGKPVPKYPQWVRALNACEKCGNAVAPLVA